MIRPRIGTLLLLINLLVLALPLSGIWVLRLYESALLRQTESELIAQGAVIVAAFRAEWRAVAGLPPLAGQGDWQPHFPTLDLAEDPILPVPPDPVPAAAPAEATAAAAGARLAPVLRETQRITLAGVSIVDAGGVVVATTGTVLGLSLAAREEVGQALAGRAHSLLRQRVTDFVPPSLESISRGGHLRVFVALPIVEGERVLGAVVLSRTPRTIAQALYGKRWHLLTLALLLLGSVAALAAVGALTVARPLRAVTDQAKRVADGAPASALPAARRPMVREVAELSEALARMAATLEHRADYIQDFAAQVSHEFKTPLAAIRGTVELLRDHLEEMSPDQRERFLANLDGDADRLDRLVRRLLELARADIRRPPAAECCDAAAVIDGLAARYRAAGLRVALDVASGPPVALPAEVLETVLRNLLDNVRQHAGPAAGVTLTLRQQRSGQALLVVADDGPGISPANAARVFDRFFTTARRSGGTGLGLAIVHSLLNAHGGRIDLAPAPVGATFAIHLPARPESQPLRPQPGRCPP